MKVNLAQLAIELGLATAAVGAICRLWQSF